MPILVTVLEVMQKAEKTTPFHGDVVVKVVFLYI